MAKFYGKVGYAITSEQEDSPGVWVENITEKSYFGDVTRNTRKLTGTGVNDDVTVSNEISIVSDPYGMQNFHAIRYVEWMGAKWKVTSVDVQYPRLNLTIGGVYNGQED